MERILFPCDANAPVEIEGIFFPKNSCVDLCFIKFKGEPYLTAPRFKLTDSQILDEILAMGYPPFTGFKSVLLADVGQIAGYLKSTTGKIIGEETSYIDRQDYYLISARVKGGNSGGPIIRSYLKIHACTKT